MSPFFIESLGQFQFLVMPLFIVLGFSMTAFLFWRAGRHEFIESRLLFDFMAVVLAGAFIVGRVFDFIVRYQVYNWSLARLFFLNAYGGIDFYGAGIGAFLAGALYLRRKKEKALLVFDLAVAPIAFGMAIIALGNFLNGRARISLLYFLGFFLIFWVLKRLDVRKFHTGFFTSLFLVLVMVLDLLLFGFRSDRTKVFQIVYWQPLIVGVILVSTLVFWYVIRGRRLRDDIKRLSAQFLLAMFTFKRAFTSLVEADQLAKSIIWFPWYLAKKLYVFVKLLCWEVYWGLAGFLKAIGVKK